MALYLENDRVRIAQHGEQLVCSRRVPPDDRRAGMHAEPGTLMIDNKTGVLSLAFGAAEDWSYESPAVQTLYTNARSLLGKLNELPTTHKSPYPLLDVLIAGIKKHDVDASKRKQWERVSLDETSPANEEFLMIIGKGPDTRIAAGRVIKTARSAYDNWTMGVDRIIQFNLSPGWKINFRHFSPSQQHIVGVDEKDEQSVYVSRDKNTKNWNGGVYKVNFDTFLRFYLHKEIQEELRRKNTP